VQGGEEKVYIAYSVWVNSTLKFEIALTSRSAGDVGARWTSPIYVNTPHNGWDFSQEMTITDAGVLYMFWYKDTNNSLYQRRIFRSVSLNGSNWSAEQYLTTSYFYYTSGDSPLAATGVYNGAIFAFRNLPSIYTLSLANDY
jgi:hypothetical protein